MSRFLSKPSIPRKSPTPAEAIVFPALTDLPDYAAAVGKLHELQATQRRLADIIERSRQALRRVPGGGRPGLDAAATALLAGKPADRGDLRTDLDEAQYELAVHDQAIELQTKALATARDKAVKQIAAQLMPAYQATARNLAEALKTLIAALREQMAFQDQLERRDLAHGFPQIFFHVPGSTPKDTLQAAERWLVEHAPILR